MVLTDVHAIAGLLLGRLLHGRAGAAPPLPPVPRVFPARLRGRLARTAGAPRSRAEAAGVLLACLPDADVLWALTGGWRRHRGPSHSALATAACALLAAPPLALWLRTGTLRAAVFAGACLGSHLALDWIGNAGIALWWPLASSSNPKQALGAVTVMDVPVAAAMYAAFEARDRARPEIILGALLVFFTAYLRWKKGQLDAAAAEFRRRHLYSGQGDYWIHPWAIFPRTFSLVRCADQRVVETISAPAQMSGRGDDMAAVPNISPGPTAVRKMLFAHPALLFDATISGSLMIAFWVWQLLRLYRTKQRQ